MVLLRWGFVGVGYICSDFITSLQPCPNDHELIAVCSRSCANAQEFANKFNIPKAYDCYVKLAKDRDINIVYISTINPLHFKVAKVMLENCKHVLCEKPLAMNEKQTRELTSIAKERGLYLSEGIWTRSLPLYKELPRTIESGFIGEVMHVTVTFGLNCTGYKNICSKEVGGGSIMYLSVYPLQLALLVFPNLRPCEIIVRGDLYDSGVDHTAVVEMIYPCEKYFLFTVSSKTPLANEAVIAGTTGVIRIPKFWCATRMMTPHNTLEFPMPRNFGKFTFENGAGLIYQADVAKRCIDRDHCENPNLTHEESIQIANWRDNIRRQLGVIFPEDQLEVAGDH